MDDLDDHLAGLDRLQDFGADRLFAHTVGEGPHHFQRDVGFQEGPANLAQRRAHILLGKCAAPREAIQDGPEAVLE